jgi:hypothetical protein
MKIMRAVKKYLASAAVIVSTMLSSSVLRADVSFPVEYFLPNNHGKSLTTPTGWGSAYGSIFAGFAMSSPAPYTNKSDGAGAIGVGIGNPVKNLGLQATLVSLDLSDWKRYAVNLHLHRYLGCASSVAVGVQNVLLSNGSDSEESYYVVFSQGVLREPFVNKKNGTTSLHYSIGAGNGVFGNKSPDDIASGKGKHGTYVFGNLAYELFDTVNVITEWNGVNLNAGISKTFFIDDKIPVVIRLGAADLTSYSGDGVRFIAGIGTGITL